MTVPPALFRKAVLEGIPYPVKAAYVQCANPLLAYADSRQTYEALTKLDFLAVSDIFMTPTAALADIVLPAASWLEVDEIVGLPYIAHNVVLAQQKIVRVGECRQDEEVSLQCLSYSAGAPSG